MTKSPDFESVMLEGARRSLALFVLKTCPSYCMGWVHRKICKTMDRFLSDVLEKKSPRLIITMPPRSGKSELVSRRFPAYAFGRAPDLQIIAASYSSDLSSRFNRDVQRIIDSDEYAKIFPDTVLAGRSLPKGMSRSTAYVRTSDIFEIVGHSGSYRSTGVGGGITGAGADILLLDDVVKDRAEASSETIRQSVWDWYTSTAYTRLSAGGGVVAMMTRWHTDDLIGRLIEHMNDGSGDAFEVINFPAIAEEDEEFRKRGEALHPERYPVERLEQIKSTVGMRDWEALYQQHPVPDGGALFRAEWIKEWTQSSLPPRFDQMLVSWDMTFKDSKKSDFVVGQVWGRKGSSHYLIDQVRGRWDFVRTKEMFLQLAEKHPLATKKLIEDKANGSAIISELKQAVAGIVPITPHESKEARASAVSTFWEAGNVFIPSAGEAPWTNEFKSELLNFPSGAHDDQVDAMSQALNYFREHKGLLFSPADKKALMTPYRR